MSPVRQAPITKHLLQIGDARKGFEVTPESVDLVFTSPPYPMIEMWDAVFMKMNSRIKTALSKGRGIEAFEFMHAELDLVWRHCFDSLKAGGFLIINVGDAVRTIQSNFGLYPNHARIISKCVSMGLTPLPGILWRKQTNAPNKFMGSGMLPSGAYVTLEHEHILIFRKGGKRQFKSEASKLIRQQSAIFWEERNNWFSDVWQDLKGERQKINGSRTRARSGAFPFTLADRIVNMYSTSGDTVLDPFSGTGTTALAALASKRNSVSVEIDRGFKKHFYDRLLGSEVVLREHACQRLRNHVEFVENRISEGKPLKHKNRHYGFAVVTGQEKEILFQVPESIEQKANEVIAHHAPIESKSEFTKFETTRTERKRAALPA